MLDTREVADLLQEYGERSALRGGNPYRARAYRRAAENLLTLTKPLAEVIDKGELNAVPGIGDKIADIVTKLARQGTHPSLERLRRETPAGLVAMASIPGLRPRQIAKLRELLGIESLVELERAAREGRIAKQKGLGSGLQHKIIQGIEIKKQAAGKKHVHRAAALLDSAKHRIERDRPELSDVTIAGDMRRGCELVADMRLVAAGPVKRVETIESSADLKLVIAPKSRFGSALLLATGSTAHVEQLQARAIARGMRLSAEGLMLNARRLASKTEEEIYEALDLQYIEPELREGESEISLAEKRRLPKLVQDTDVRGIVHAHTDESDGVDTLEELVRATVDHGYSYLAISDHSKSAHYAGGLTVEQIETQHREVARLNKRYGSETFRIFHGIESDILNDGSLDYPSSILRSFDFVIASVHSQFRKDVTSQTKRILNAVSNPHTTILGHLTGRQLLRRTGYEVDVEAVLRACAKHRVAVEINANPWRLDLDWRWHRTASELGCMMSVDPDAHSVHEIEFTHWGVEVARKGGLPKERILSCLSLQEFQKYLRARKR